MAASAAHAFPDLEVQMTGTGHYVHRLNAYVIDTQVQSFLLTLGVLAAVFIALFGMRLGLAGFVSNLFPVLVATGSLCLLSVPFDFATVLVAGVTLGLSVDDSIHFLHHFKRERQAAGMEAGMAASMGLVARPIVLTSLLFCAGIAVFLASSLVVLVKFALFTIAGLLAAMASALLLLPWLVGYTARHDQAPPRQPRGNE